MAPALPTTHATELTHLTPAHDPTQDLVRAFEAFDPHRRGYISAGELRAVMAGAASIGAPAAASEVLAAPSTVDDLVSYADPGDLGLVHYGPLAARLFADYAAHERNKVIEKAAAAANPRK